MKGHDLSRYINLEIIKAYTNMVRKAIRLISKEMSTHKRRKKSKNWIWDEHFNGREGKHIIKYSFAGKQSFSTSLVVARIQLYWHNKNNKKYYIVYLVFIHLHF